MARKKKSFLMRMILFLVGLVVLSVFGLFLVGVIWVGPMVKKALETYGPEALGAEVKVEEVDIVLFRGVAKVRGMVIGNPEGYREPVAIEAENFRLNLNLRSLFTDTIVITDILVEKPIITYEKRKGVDNLNHLLSNATAWADSLSSKEEGDDPPKKVIIKRLRLVDGVLRVKLPHLPAVPVKLPYIERTNIGEGKPEGQNFGQATKEILGSLYEESSDVVKNAGDAIEKAGNNALEASKDLGDKTLKAGEKALEGAGDAVKGLFGK